MTTAPPPPEGGSDPHRDNWVPVPLRSKKYDPEAKTYTIEFEAPKQLLLNQQFEAMVHDELLRHADRAGLIIEGQVVVTTEDIPTPEQKPLTEGEPLMPGIMSDKERKFREQMAERNRAMMEALGFPPPSLARPPMDKMLVRAEAMVAMNLNSEPTVLAEEPKQPERMSDVDIEKAIAEFEIPDDLSGLDG